MHARPGGGSACQAPASGGAQPLSNTRARLAPPFSGLSATQPWLLTAQRTLPPRSRRSPGWRAPAARRCADPDAGAAGKQGQARGACQPAAAAAAACRRLPPLTAAPARLPCRRSAAIVSRRWHSCAHAPALCHDVGIEAAQQSKQAQELASFAGWLQRHGQHVQRLTIRVFTFEEPQEQTAACREQLLQCLNTCRCVTQQLGQLYVASSLAAALAAAAWPPPLPGTLQDLGLYTNGSEPLHINCSLHGLTRLTTLILFSRSGGVLLGQHVALPPSILALALQDRGSDALPEQASWEWAVA